MSLRCRRFFPKLVRMSVLVAGLVCISVTHCAAADATQRLQSAVHRLNARLVDGEKAEGWRRYLLLNVLETQAAKGEQADIATLHQLYHRFVSGADGLEHPIFSDVRDALRNQIESLTASFSNDLNFAVGRAATQFRPITVDQMETYRDRAKRELESLVNFYRAELPSASRADAFYSLQIDEAIQFLDEIEFELPPEISVGKMTSMINDVQQELNSVIEKIDALPFRSDDQPQPNNQNNKAEDQADQLDLDGPGPDDDGPAPDDDSNLADLKLQRESLETRITELKKQRSEIRAIDLPRMRTRATNFTQLLKFENGFATTADDFGDPYFVSARLAFERFVRIYYYGTDDNLQEDYLLRIEKLSQEISKLDDVNDRLAAGTVGSALEWLENAFQAPELVTAIRAKYSHPNAYLSVSGHLLNRVGGQSLSQTRPLYENIKGRLVRGTASNNGQVTFDLIDDPNQVHVSILARTDVTSNTYLQQGKIYAYVDAVGQAEARRSILMNVGGLLAGEPYAAANMNTFFQGTSSHCRLVNRIASKQFAEKQAEGNVGASSRVRKELLERFHSETNLPIANGKSALANAKLKSRNRSNYVPELYAHTEANRIVVVGKKASKATLAAPSRPFSHGMNSDIELRLHDSLLSNYVDPIFSGKTFSNEELAQEFEKLTGKESVALGPEQAEDGGNAEDESFSITFSNVRPIQFAFDENTLSVIVSGKSFAQGDKKIDAGLTIKVRFRIIRDNGELKLVRDGKAELDYVDAENKDARIVGFRSFLDGRLNPKDEKTQEIKLPENLLPVDQIEALKDRPVARSMQISQCRIEGGWVYLGWNYQPQGAFTSRPVDLPAIWNKATVEQMDSIYTPVGH